MKAESSLWEAWPQSTQCSGFQEHWWLSAVVLGLLHPGSRRSARRILMATMPSKRQVLMVVWENVYIPLSYHTPMARHLSTNSINKAPYWDFPGSSVVKNLQKTRVRSLVQGPVALEQLSPYTHNYWACALGSMSLNYQSPYALEPMNHNKRSQCKEKPSLHYEE